MYTLFVILSFFLGYGFHNWLHNKISSVASALVANVKADITRIENKVTELKAKI